MLITLYIIFRDMSLAKFKCFRLPSITAWSRSRHATSRVIKNGSNHFFPIKAIKVDEFTTRALKGAHSVSESFALAAQPSLQPPLGKTKHVPHYAHTHSSRWCAHTTYEARPSKLNLKERKICLHCNNTVGIN